MVKSFQQLDTIQTNKIIMITRPHYAVALPGKFGVNVLAKHGKRITLAYFSLSNFVLC